MKTIDLGLVEISTYRKNKLICSGDDRASLMDMNEVIIPANTKLYTFKIDYPLTNPYVVKLAFPFGCTRREMVNYIVNVYRTIYKIEKNTTTKPVRNIPGMFNRDTTDGYYGIWGHHIQDLMLHSLYIDRKRITVGVSS